MRSTDDFAAAIAALDLNPIKIKLMHHQSGEGWTREKADAVEFEYRRFLALMKLFPNEQTSPSIEVDTFWHHHILDTARYAADCDKIFGYFLHHDPFIGMGSGQDHAEVHLRCAERMRELHQQIFGPPRASVAAYCGTPPGAAAYCGAPAMPVRSTTAFAQIAYCGASAAQDRTGAAKRSGQAT